MNLRIKLQAISLKSLGLKIKMKNGEHILLNLLHQYLGRWSASNQAFDLKNRINLKNTWDDIFGIIKQNFWAENQDIMDDSFLNNVSALGGESSDNEYPIDENSLEDKKVNKTSASQHIRIKYHSNGLTFKLGLISSLVFVKNIYIEEIVEFKKYLDKLPKKIFSKNPKFNLRALKNFKLTQTHLVIKNSPQISIPLNFGYEFPKDIPGLMQYFIEPINYFGSFSRDDIIRLNITLKKGQFQANKNVQINGFRNIEPQYKEIKDWISQFEQKTPLDFKNSLPRNLSIFDFIIYINNLIISEFSYVTPLQFQATKQDKNTSLLNFCPYGKICLLEFKTWKETLKFYAKNIYQNK